MTTFPPAQLPPPIFLPPDITALPPARFFPGQPIRRLANPGRRLGARLIDTAIQIALFYGGGIVLGSIAAPFTSNDRDSLPGPLAVLFGTSAAAFLIAWLLYEPLFVWKKGGTPGKLWLGIRIVRVLDAGRLSFGNALGRYVSGVLIGFLPFVGFLDVLWLLWDRPLYQCLHDKIAITVVVERE